MKKTKFFQMLLVFVFVFTLSFTMLSYAKTTTLTMFAVNKYLKESAEEYNKLNPNVKVDVVILPYYGGFMKKIALSIAGQNLPDLIQVTTAYMPQVSKYLLDVGPSIKSSLGLSPEKYRAQILPSMDVFLGKKGEVKGIPLEVTGTSIWINKKMFEKAGITPPPLNGEKDSTWSWSEFINALKKVKKANNLSYALAFDYSADRFYNFISIWGATVLDEKVNFVLDKYPAGAMLFDLFISLFKDKIIPAEEWLAGASAQRDFFEGLTCAYWSGSWQCGPMMEQSKETGIEYVPVYIPKALDWWGLPGGSFMGAFKTGNKEKEKAALDFIAWMADKNKGYLTYIKPGLQLSAYKDHKVDYGIEKMNKWQETYGALLSRVPGWTMTTRANATWSKLYDLIRKQIALGINGEVNGEEIVNNLKKAYEDIANK